MEDKPLARADLGLADASPSPRLVANVHLADQAEDGDPAPAPVDDDVMASKEWDPPASRRRRTSAMAESLRTRAPPNLPRKSCQGAVRPGRQPAAPPSTAPPHWAGWRRWLRRWTTPRGRCVVLPGSGTPRVLPSRHPSRRRGEREQPAIATWRRRRPGAAHHPFACTGAQERIVAIAARRRSRHCRCGHGELPVGDLGVGFVDIVDTFFHHPSPAEASQHRTQ